MRILYSENTHGNYWEIETAEDFRPYLMKCDRIQSRLKQGSPADSGFAVVVWLMSNVIAVESEGGYVPMAGHTIERVSSCGCSCHR